MYSLLAEMQSFTYILQYMHKKLSLHATGLITTLVSIIFLIVKIVQNSLFLMQYTKRANLLDCVKKCTLETSLKKPSNN